MPENEKEFDRVETLPSIDVIYGMSPSMAAVRNMVEKVAPTTLPVLLQGESGTGKDVIARLLHIRSKRANLPMVKVTCPAIPDSLIEAELFGYEKGAFTGATSLKRGRVELSHLGTLFLDEIGCLCPSMQVKLLQLLQDGTFARLGALEPLRIDTRLICATNDNLLELTELDKFRRDFLYRINTITIALPPLRHRLEDLPALSDYFLGLYSRTFHVDPKPIPCEIMHKMQSYHWPGNIRELENMIGGFVLIGQPDWMNMQLVQSATAKPVPDFDVSKPISLKSITRATTDRLEQQIIWKVLQMNGWNRVKTAQWLKISYRSLMYKLQQVHSSRAKYREGQDGHTSSGQR